MEHIAIPWDKILPIQSEFSIGTRIAAVGFLQATTVHHVHERSVRSQEA